MHQQMPTWSEPPSLCSFASTKQCSTCKSRRLSPLTLYTVGTNVLPNFLVIKIPHKIIVVQHKNRGASFKGMYSTLHVNFHAFSIHHAMFVDFFFPPTNFPPIRTSIHQYSDSRPFLFVYWVFLQANSTGFVQVDTKS